MENPFKSPPGHGKEAGARLSPKGETGMLSKYSQIRFVTEVNTGEDACATPMKWNVGQVKEDWADSLIKENTYGLAS
jgi:hypothetical protein